MNLDGALPNEGDIVIESDGNVPFTVDHIDNGEIVGYTPDGDEVSVPMEHDLHVLDELDL
jgi:hypothetical protein